MSSLQWHHGKSMQPGRPFQLSDRDAVLPFCGGPTGKPDEELHRATMPTSRSERNAEDSIVLSGTAFIWTGSSRRNHAGHGYRTAF